MKHFSDMRVQCFIKTQKQKIILFVVLCCMVSAYVVLFHMLNNAPILTNSIYHKQPVPGENNIIFIESSCADGHYQRPKRLLHSSRQACSIESAARLNPNSTIYLLYTCPISVNFIEESRNRVFWILQYSNVRIWQLVLDDYFAGTPLEHFYLSGGWNTSKWPVPHASDVLRYLSLWKFGGTYLDLDCIVIRPIDDLGSNFAGAETEFVIGSAVLNLGFDRIGRAIARACLEELNTNFRGKYWNENGPGIITRVVAKICNTTNAEQMTADICSGFTVHQRYTFYPIHYVGDFDLFFNETLREKTMERLKHAHTVHLWNEETKGMPVVVGSLQGLALIAKESCPKVYTHSGRRF